MADEVSKPTSTPLEEGNKSDGANEEVVSPMVPFEALDLKSTDSIEESLNTPELQPSKSMIANAHDSLKALSVKEGPNRSSLILPNERTRSGPLSGGDFDHRLSQDDNEDHIPVDSVIDQGSADQNPCGFRLDSSLIRKSYIFKETSKNERTGRKLQFVDEVSRKCPFIIFIHLVSHPSTVPFNMSSFI
jgi:hypothetical protein